MVDLFFFIMTNLFLFRNRNSWDSRLNLILLQWPRLTFQNSSIPVSLKIRDNFINFISYNCLKVGREWWYFKWPYSLLEPHRPCFSTNEHPRILRVIVLSIWDYHTLSVVYWKSAVHYLREQSHTRYSFKKTFFFFIAAFFVRIVLIIFCDRWNDGCQGDHA